MYEACVRWCAVAMAMTCPPTLLVAVRRQCVPMQCAGVFSCDDMCVWRGGGRGGGEGRGSELGGWDVLGVL